MEELINQYRYLVGGYYGVSLIDEYPIKEYILKDIEDYFYICCRYRRIYQRFY